MKIKSMLVALGAAGLAATASAGSITFSFNPNGTGSAGAIGGAGVLDQAAGNVLATNAVNGGNALAVGTIINDYYQANLSAVQDTNTLNVFSNGAGGKFFTFVATFTERVIASSSGGGVVNSSFEVLSGTFKMCAQSSLGNNLAGTGFSCAGNGILTGSIFGGNATQTGFTTALAPLDGSLANNYSGVQTVTSSGSSQLSATITSVDAGYFPDLLVGSSLTLAAINSSLITPYSQIDPSALFSSNTIANGDTSGVPTVGSINGITGPNFMFQADANSSFSRQAVPEPGALALAGLALAGLATVRRRTAK